jgi:predicted AAA+ superfamily ATPase
MVWTKIVNMKLMIFLVCCRQDETSFLGEGNIGLYQVCYDLSDTLTRKREIVALEEAMEECGVGESYLITRYAKEDITMKERTIRIVPAWDWLMH